MSSQQDIGPDVTLTSRIAVPEHVVYRQFAAETVLLNLETGQYHGVNPTGGRMLEVLESVGTLGAAAAELAAEYDQPTEKLEQDVRDFCVSLAARGLIEVDGSVEGDGSGRD